MRAASQAHAAAYWSTQLAGCAQPPLVPTDHPRSGAEFGPGAFRGDHRARVHPPHVDATGDRVEGVAFWDVVDVVGTRESEREERVAVGHESERVRLAGRA